MSFGTYLPPVVAQVIADTKSFTGGVGVVKKELVGLEAAMAKMSAVGKVAMAGLAIGVAAVAFESTKLAMNFDQTMEMIHTQAGASQAEVDSLSQSVLDLAGTVGIGPTKLAEGLYHIESTGMRGAQALDILTQSAKLAAIGMADLDDVTYAMSGVMSVGMKDVHNAAEAIAFMNATVGMGDMRMAQLASAIGTGVLPAFKSAGLGMVDFSAAIATITDNSTPADEAATRLRMTIAMMAAPSGPAVEALASIGLGAKDLATDLTKEDGLLVAVEDLKAHLAGLSTVDANAIIEHAFGGGKTSGAIQTLLLESEKLKSKYDQLGTAEERAAKTDEAWAAQRKQFAQQWHELTATVEAYGVKIGNWLIPHIQDSVKWMQAHSDVVKIMAGLVGGVLVAAMTAFTASVIANTAALLADPVTWIVIAIVAAVALLVVGIYELYDNWDTVWGGIVDISMVVWRALVGAWFATVHALQDGASWVKSKVIDPIVAWFDRWLLRPIEAILNFLQVVFLFAFGFISTVIESYQRKWDFAWHAVAGVVMWAWSNILRPVLHFVVEYGLRPVQAAVGWLADVWGRAWHAITDAAVWAWTNVIKPTMAFIDKYGLAPIRMAIDALQSAWDVAWSAITAVVSKAWEFVRPIFDAFTSAIDRIRDGLGWIADHPGKAGADFAHLLGFAQGGVVPGPVGAPMLAVVHGGEQILSNDQLNSMGRGRTLTSGAAAAQFGGGGDGDIVIHQHLYTPDGREQRTEVLRYARRKGQNPIDMYPATARNVR